MCLILIAVDVHPRFRLVAAANRDEFYARPTAPAAFWKDRPGLLAGRDLKAGGTWLGITRTGRFAAVTNYRDPASFREKAPSRGRLVTGFLTGDESPQACIDALAPSAGRYNGFNLILGEGRDVFWYSNRGGTGRRLAPGIYGLSNRLLDTPWPKVRRAKKMFREALSAGGDMDPEALFRVLADRTRPPDRDLPDTGMGIEWERILSPVFISSPTYGTRSSTLLFIDRKDRVTFLERTFNSDPDHASTVRYEFRIAGRTGAPPRTG